MSPVFYKSGSYDKRGIKMSNEEVNKTERNLRTLLDWYRLKRVNEFVAQCDEVHAWNTIQKRIRRHRLIRVCSYWGSAAAACLFVAFLGVYSSGGREQSLFDNRGEIKATLIINGGESSYDLLSQDKSILDIYGKKIAQNTKAELRYDIQSGVKNDAEGDHILDVPRGGEYRLVLSDGTHVHANADSRLVYAASFTGDKREVYLTGEALFDVAKDPDHPFIVHTPYGIVEAVGTRFNVNTYESDQTTVTLEEGMVKVYMKDDEESGEKTLLPGEQAVMQLDTINTRAVQAEEYTSWADGIYEYTDTSLETIVRQLSRWYDVDMSFVDPRLKERRFTGVIFRDQPLRKVLDILSRVSGVYFSQKGDVIVISENRQ